MNWFMDHCMDKVYLGDGVYVDNDGFNVILTTEDGVTVTNTIYLEPDVMQALLQYYKKQAVNP